MTASEVANFSAGPSALPREVLEGARAELLDFDHTGMSVMEQSHRTPPYEAVHFQAEALVRELLSVPDTHEILFLQGGASQQFALVPMNLLRPGGVADYVLTGVWSEKAHEEACRVGAARVVGDGKSQRAGTGSSADTGASGFSAYTRIPQQHELQLSAAADYVHITSNNTIVGTQWQCFPDTAGAPLVADMSSDIFSRPLDVSEFGLIYAGAQKNLGPSGVTLVIVRKDLLGRAPASLPKIFRYSVHAENRSLYNTPPTFAIYLVCRVLQHLKASGGVAGAAQRASERARLVYEALDARPDWYRSDVEREARSQMNLVFRLPTPELEKRFLERAAALRMVGLKGHRLVGGIRASLYNAVPLRWVERLTTLIAEFQG